MQRRLPQGWGLAAKYPGDKGIERDPAVAKEAEEAGYLCVEGDATVDEIWELSGRRVTRWAGNYGDFVRQKEEATALQERRYRVQQGQIRRLMFQARRYRDMANAYDDPKQAKRAKAMKRSGWSNSRLATATT